MGRIDIIRQAITDWEERWVAEAWLDGRLHEKIKNDLIDTIETHIASQELKCNDALQSEVESKKRPGRPKKFA